MKKAFTFLFFIFLAPALFAQKVEVSAFANGGLFHFTGISATPQTFINGAGSASAYTNNPYGSKNGFSYGAGLQTKFIFAPGIIAGLQTGYDVLRSRVNINEAYPYINFLANANYAPASPISVNGHTTLQNTFINIEPFIGYRLLNGRYKLDILPGLDIGLGLKSHEHGKATGQDGTVYTTDVSRGKPRTDARLRLGFEAGYRQWGLMVSYASGKTDCQGNVIGNANSEAFSSLLRFGLSYRLL